MIFSGIRLQTLVPKFTIDSPPKRTVRIFVLCELGSLHIEKHPPLLQGKDLFNFESFRCKVLQFFFTNS